MDLRELARRRVLPVDCRHVRVAHPGESPVRRLDLLVGRGGADSENLVKRTSHAVRAQTRRPRLLHAASRASFGGVGSGEGEYLPESDVARRRGDGFAGESGGGRERCRKRW